jgi:hypothetical protein
MWSVRQPYAVRRTRVTTGESFYLDIDGETWQYMLVTDPEAALYWNPSSYKLKLSDIKIASKCSPEDRKRLRREILKDILDSD